MKPTKIVAATFVAAVSLAVAAPLDNDGGELIRKGSYLGRIAFVDTQSSLAFSNVQQVASLLADKTRMNVIALRHAGAKPADLKRELGVQVLVSVVDDPKEPTMLLAPEDHWGFVNVARLVDDLPGERAKRRFFEKRARKELIRAFSLMCGGGASQFRGNMMNAATMKELDLTYDTLPVDMLSHYETHLRAFGVTPKEIVSYRTACEEGWAQPPTNAVQKAVWNDVHALPTNPIKILPPNQKK